MLVIKRSAIRRNRARSVLVVELEPHRRHVLLEVRHRARARDQKHPLVAGQQPRQSDLCRRGLVLVATSTIVACPARRAGPPLNVEPSGKNGTYAIPRSRANSTISSSWRSMMLA